MADRVSTIRLKVAGGEDAARDVQKFMAMYRKQMEASNKMFAEAQAGMAMGVKPEKLKETFDTAVNLRIAAENKVARALDSAWSKERRQDDTQRKSKAEHDKIAEKRDLAVVDRQIAEHNARARAVGMQEKLADELASARIKALERYDRADAAQAAREVNRRERVLAQQQKQFDKLKKESEGGGAVDKKELGGFGAKMILGHAAGMAIGDIINDPHAGQMIGSTASAFMFGGPIVGAAVAGISLLADGIGNARQSAKELVKVQDEHAESVKRSAEWMGQLTQGYLATTKAGSAFTGKINEERQAADALKREYRDANKNLSYSEAPSMFYQTLTRGAGETDFDRTQRQRAQQYREGKARILRFQEYAREERAVATQEALETARAQVDPSRIAARLTGGPARSQAELAVSQKEEMRQYDRDTNEANRQLDRQLNELKKAGAGFVEQDKVTHEQAEYNFERFLQRKEIAKRQENEVDAQNRDFSVQVANEKFSAEEARINATERGYQRELDMLALKHQKEHDEHVRQGRDSQAMAMLTTRQADEIAAMEFKRDTALADEHLRMADAYSVARRQMRAEDAQWAEQERKLGIEKATPAQIRQAKDDFYSLSAAVRSESINSQVFANRAQRAMLEGAEHRDTRIQMLMRENPALYKTREQAAAMVDSQMQLETAQFAKQERGRLRPREQYSDYKRELDRAVKQGSMSGAEEKYLLRERAREILNGNLGGEFTSAIAHWQRVQSDIIQKNNLPQQTLEELKWVRKELSELNRGVKLAA